MSSDQTSSSSSEQGQPEASASDFGQLAALVHAFIGMMQAGGIARMDVKHHDLRLSLRAHEATAVPVQFIPRPDGGATMVTIAPDGVAESGTDHIVRAPMIGTFYVASAPNEPTFVQLGDVVEEGQTIGIIEAMKIMNEIASDRSGTVVEVLAQNAQTVEYGSPLIRIAPNTTD